MMSTYARLYLKNGNILKAEHIEHIENGIIQAASSSNITKLSELQNDVGYIVNTVANLTNYYLKNEVYTRDEVKQLIGAIPKFTIQPVASLPTENISDTTLYLLRTSEEEQNLYSEYIYVDGKWEYLGSLDGLEVISWNDLEDRPFGEMSTGSDTLEWDGNTEGLEGIVWGDGSFYHISDSVFTSDDVNAMIWSSYNSESDYTSEKSVANGYSVTVDDNGNILTNDYCIACVVEDNTVLKNEVFPKKGVYFSKTSTQVTLTLTIPNNPIFPSIKPIDSEYLPPATTDELGAVIVGDNLVVDIYGKLQAVVELPERITNSELESILI